MGSSAYERLFRFSAYRPQEKLSLLLWQLGAVLDQHGMCKVDLIVSRRRFTCDVLGFVGKNSSKAYPLGLLGSFNQEKAKKIHQLRMYIDRQNITHILSDF